MKRVIFLLFFLSAPVVLAAQDYMQTVRQALDALEHDSLDEAADCLRRALKLEPLSKSNAILYHYLGQIQERQGQAERALESYSQGLMVEPGRPELLFSRAGLHLQQNDERHALADYNELLLKQPDHVEALFFRAYIYVRQHLYRQARADYEHLLRLNPQHVEALLGLALLNDKDRRPREAMEQMNALVAMHPTHAHLYVARGGMEQQRKLYEQALVDYNHASGNVRDS